MKQPCHLCAAEPEVRRRYGLDEGESCPLCFQPTCRYHLTTVRWRWRDNGQVASAQICQACRRTYQHRSWDPVKRDWIS